MNASVGPNPMSNRTSFLKTTDPDVSGRLAEPKSAVQLVPLRRPAWLSKTVWPWQTSALQVGKTSIAVTDVGRGPVLLFVHTGFWSFIWRDVILRLAADFRCVCFDAPGTGQSDRFPASEITLERAAQTLNALIEALELRDITLVFHDLGGPSGIAGASRTPARISALCAVNAFAWKPEGAAFRGMLALAGNSLVREFDVATQLIPRITSSAFGVGRNLEPASRHAFYAGIGRQGVRTFHAYMRDAGRALKIYEEIDQALAGPFRRLPLLTIFGERNDPLRFQPRWKQLFPDARQLVVAKGNHFPMCDAPDFVAAAIKQFHQRPPAGERARRDGSQWGAAPGFVTDPLKSRLFRIGRSATDVY
ncbi:MAG TPA: alpha/beta hydrolase [Candidatus Angelobacter sp.]|nr:alpha/beta hydrolase [Candidatus Angelobacter sp.]